MSDPAAQRTRDPRKHPQKRALSAVYDIGGGRLLFVPSVPMWDVHEHTRRGHEATSLRSVALAVAPTTEGPVSGWLIRSWLKKHQCHPWVEAWLLRGEDAPAHVSVAPRDLVRRCRAALDYPGICHATGDSNLYHAYRRWVRDGTIPDRSWLEWLWGNPPPDGAFVVTPPLQRLREEMAWSGGVVRAVQTSVPTFSGSTVAWWRREPGTAAALDEALEAAKRPGGKADMPSLSETWNRLPDATKRLMWAYARAGRLSACCERADIPTPNYYALLGKAEQLGVGGHLRQYLAWEGDYAARAEAGLLAPGFFVPAPGMPRFREAAAAAMAEHDVWPRARRLQLPGFGQWFEDWTVPRPMKGKRSRLGGARAPEPSPAAAEGDEESAGRVAALNETEEAILRCVREHSTDANPMTGEAIARKIDFTWNSYFRQTLSGLVKGGHLLKVAGGGYLPG
jgi:hypothetical protein